MEPFSTYPQSVERWNVFEWVCKGPTEGNPFVEQKLEAEFCSAEEQVRVAGFYDGGGVYRLRFMPSFTGEYTFRVMASFPLEQAEGTFIVTAASAANHGPVRVRDTWHFAYEDGTPYISLGTTCYVWELQSEEQVRQTLHTLAQSPFNKIRFCVFPKHYVYNFREPFAYPYEGTPMDSSVLTEANFASFDGHAEGNNWNFERLNPVYFLRIETCIAALRDLGIQADVILFHPYDRWGFSCMPREADELYLRYVTARFASFRNVWWSLANEYDLMQDKTLSDWERIAELVCRCDPYRHLRSIHHCFHFYDFNRPWVTHCSIQRTNLYMSSELVNEWRERYRKPVVLDEIAYEGDIQHGWGNLTGEEMARRFWEAAVRGGYPGHSETYRHPDGVLWWSHGGELHGESPERIAFLAEVLAQVPGGALNPYRSCAWDEVCAVPAAIGHEDELYLYYYSFMRPSFRDFKVNGPYRVTVLDTWNMTCEDRGVREGAFRLQLPAKPYIAVLLKKCVEKSC